MGLRLVTRRAAGIGIETLTASALNTAVPGLGVLARPILQTRPAQQYLAFLTRVYSKLPGSAGKLFQKVFGASAPHTELNEHAIKNASKAFWEGHGTTEDLRALLTLDPFGFPYVVADYDVLGSVKLLQKRYIAERSGQGYAEAAARARKFLAQDPATLASTFNENQLSAFRKAGLFSLGASTATRRHALRI